MNIIKKFIGAVVDCLHLVREVNGVRTPQKLHQVVHNQRVAAGEKCCGGGCK